MKSEIVQDNAKANGHLSLHTGQAAKSNGHATPTSDAARAPQVVKFECRYCSRNFKSFSGLVEHFLATHRTVSV